LGKTSLEVSFDVALHFGSLIAVVFYFRDDLKKLTLSLSSKHPDYAYRRVLVFLLIATLPAGILGFIFKDFFVGLFAKPLGVAFQLLITGLILFLADSSSRPHKSINEMTTLDSLIIGFAQAIAIVPGISRSGATISAGMWSGLKREEAARFSFLLSIPAIFGATLFSLNDLTLSHMAGVVIIGFLTSLIVSYLAIKYLISYLKRGNLRIFAYYCWAVGGFFIVYLFIK
jgi:undecaprenyl-diphosphatase